MTPTAVNGMGYCGPHGVGWDAFLRFASSAPTSESPLAMVEWAAPFPPAGQARELAAPADLRGTLEGRGLRAFNREGKLLAAACQGALTQAGNSSAWPRDEVGLFAGSSSAGLDDYCTLCAEKEQWGVKRLTPSRGPNAGFNAHLGHVSKWFDLRGVTLGVAAGGCSGAAALAAASRELQLGTVQHAVAGAVEARAHLRIQSCSSSSCVVEGAMAFSLSRDSESPRAYITSCGEVFVPDANRETFIRAATWLRRGFERAMGSMPSQIVVTGLAARAARRNWDALLESIGPIPHVLDVDERWGDWLGVGSCLGVALAIAHVSGELRCPGYDACDAVGVVSLDEQGAIIFHLVESPARSGKGSACG